MARLLDPLRLLRRLGAEFQRRAQQSDLRLPLELGLWVEGRKYQLDVTAEGVAVAARRLGPNYLRLNLADFTRLVLGQLDWRQALADGRLELSDTAVEATGRVLFPSFSLWRSPLDDLP
jgi:hypothetical protein